LKFPQTEQEFNAAYCGTELIEYIKELQMKAQAWKEDAIWHGKQSVVILEQTEPDFMNG
jgi:hypothetical protein